MTRARLLWIITGTYWVILFVLTHLPAAPRVPGLELSDKLMHGGAYFSLTVLLFFTFWLAHPTRNAATWSAGVALLYGIVDEILQIPVGRDCELNDWLADAAGVGVAILLMLLVRSLVASRRA